MIVPVQDFVDALNIIFPDSKRGIMRKPSFLTEMGASLPETELLTVKKMHLIDRKQPTERNSVLTYFVRKILKELLLSVRRQSNFLPLMEEELYCLVQICYELSNVEEESQVLSFYHLIKQSWKREWRLSKGEGEEKYGAVRKIVKTNSFNNK